MSDSIVTMVYSFDCDGVVLNSNKLKIDAMLKAILSCGFSRPKAESCVGFFQHNFGLSRYFHVNYFLENILLVSGKARDSYEEEILKNYSEILSKTYANAEFCNGFVDFMESLCGPCNIVSSSDQTELTEVLKHKGLRSKVDYILGSPVSKKDNLINLKKSYPMDTLHTYYGDSTADLIAAKEAGYNFVGILGYSMVAGELKTQCLAENYQFINVFTDLL